MLETLSMYSISCESRRLASAIRSLDASRPDLNRTSPWRRKSGLLRHDLESCIVWCTPSSWVTRCFLGEDDLDRITCCWPVVCWPVAMAAVAAPRDERAAMARDARA